MSIKRKQIIPLTLYDQGREARFYRWLRWDKTRYLRLDAPPQQCVSHLNDFLNSQKYGQQSVSHAAFPSHFEVRMHVWGHKSYEGEVTISIRENAVDAAQSDVFVRVYPGDDTAPIGCLVVFFVVISGLVFGFSHITSHTLSNYLAVAAMLGMCLLLPSLSMVYKRNDLLTNVTTHLEQLTLKSKSKGLPHEQNA